MKTIKEIEEEIKALEQTNTDDFTDAEHSKLSKKLKLLRDCKIYLESNPSEEFILSERERLIKVIEVIKNGFGAFFQNTPSSVWDNDSSKAQTVYNKLMQTSKHKRHLANINYLLN